MSNQALKTSSGPAEVTEHTASLLQFIKGDKHLYKNCVSIRDTVFQSNIEQLFNSRKWNTGYKNIRALVKRFAHSLRNLSSHQIPKNIALALEQLDVPHGTPSGRDAVDAFRLIYDEIIVPVERLSVGKTLTIISPVVTEIQNKNASEVTALLDISPVVLDAFQQWKNYESRYEPDMRSIWGKEDNNIELSLEEKEKIGAYESMSSGLKETCLALLMESGMTRDCAWDWMRSHYR